MKRIEVKQSRVIVLLNYGFPVVQIFRRCVPSSSGPVYPSGNGQSPGRLLQVGASIQLVNFYSWVKVLSCPLLTQLEKLVPDILLIFYYLPSILRQKMAWHSLVV
jgi:hypothetical protein